MEISSFTVILTEECNFRCGYCQQEHRGTRLDSALLSRALRFFEPYFAREFAVGFYGGEPLLAVSEIKQAVEQLERSSEKRHIRGGYSLTTNGSLLNDEILDFLDRHAFSLLLSFDGLAQDIARKKGSFDFLVSIIPKILGRPRISLETNSVFTPETVGYLSDSIKLIHQLGVRKTNVAFRLGSPWKASSVLLLKRELARVRKYSLSRFKDAAELPWAELGEEREKGVYGCPAGLNKMALAADGTLWGCFLFPQYFGGSRISAEFQEFCFGGVDVFIKNHRQIYPRIMENYSALRMDRFSTPDRLCAFCDEVEECWICPVAAAQSSGRIGLIPPSICQGARTWRKEQKLFLKQLERAIQYEKSAAEG